MTTTLPPITHKQQEILTLLYRFRFLDRTHIQALLGHKDKKRILSWLKDLREKQYVDWHYDADDFTARTKPAIYYLSINGIRYLRSLNKYPSQELRKRYKESTRTLGFMDRCLLIADCCIALQTKSSEDVSYSYTLEADTSSSSSDALKPHLSFVKQHEATATNYLLEIIEATLPRYQLRKRLKDYVDYLVDEDWKDNLNKAPVILFACLNTADLLYVKRRIRTLLEDEDIENYAIRVTTAEKLKAQGITSMIWEEV